MEILRPALLHEWQTNPWLLERDVPLWISLVNNKGVVRVLIDHTKIPSNAGMNMYLMPRGFWVNLYEAIGYSHLGLGVIRPYISVVYNLGQTNPTIVDFPGIFCYTQRLSKAMVNNSEFLIPDLRRIISQYICFI